MTCLQELATKVPGACCALLATTAGIADFTASFRAQLVWQECQRLLFQQLVWQDCQRLLGRIAVHEIPHSRELAGLVR